MTDKEKGTAIKMKEDGYNASEIARYLKRGSSTIERLLKKNGYKNTGNTILFTQQEKELIEHLYTAKRMNSLEVWESNFKDRCCSKTIELYIKNSGLSRGRGRGMYNKSINHRYFQRIDSPDKAYLLGNVTADASVSNGKTLRFEVSSKDVEILDYAKTQLNVDTDIHTYQREGRNDTCVLNASSIDLVNDLVNYNVVKNKQSQDFGLPDIPREYMRDFMRGYFDGDGSVFKKSDGRYGVSICCTETFAKESLSMLVGFGIITNPRATNIVDMRKYGIDIFHLRLITKDSINKFAKYIYRDGYFSLNRKREIFEQHAKRHANTEITCKVQAS